MREILFRGKRIDNGEWVDGYLLDDGMVEVEHYFVGRIVVEPYKGTACDDWTINGIDFCEIDPETICQYTGLKDKNGNRIWENDIVSGYFNHKKITGFIKYGSNAVYYIEREGSYGIHLDNSEDWLEVIGNIFDNPELLKGE